VHTPPLHTLAMASLAHADDGSGDDLNNEIPPAAPSNASISSLKDVMSAISAWELANDSKDPVVCGSDLMS